MRKSGIITILAIAAGISGAAAVVSPVLAQGGGQVAAPTARAGLNIAEIYQRLDAAGYTAIDEIERERNTYEVKATDREGRRVELDVDAVSGEILKTEIKRSKGTNGGRAPQAQSSR